MTLKNPDLSLQHLTEKINEKKSAPIQLVKSLLNATHEQTHENANMNYSFASAFYRIAGETIKEYCLEELYPREISDAHRSGAVHIHDLDMGIVGYCCGWSLMDLLTLGFNGVPGKTESAPPKHFSTALGQMVNFLGVLQNNWAGAMAFNSVDTLLAPYIAFDGLDYDTVEQKIQEHIHNINTTSRWGGQSPFTNYSFDLTPPKDLALLPILNGNTYADFQKEMDMFNLAFCKVMTDGDMHGRPFTFPIPSYNLTKDFDWDGPVSDALFKMTAKYGIPYFQNFIGLDGDPTAVRSMCCRLRIELSELLNREGGTFGYADKTGSCGVVTINLPQAAYLARNEEGFLTRVGHLMDLAQDSLEIKRVEVQKNFDNGLLPWTKRYLRNLDFHFSTIGLVGMNEACIELLGEGIASENGVRLAEKTLKYMRDKIIQFQKKTGHLYNLEESPAEGASWRLARMDKKRYPGITVANPGEADSFYTNSSHLPVDFDLPLGKVLVHQERLQQYYNGGSVVHVFLGERNPYPEGVKKLVRRIATHTKIKNFTITPTTSICPNHGYLSGEHFTCPACGAKCEVISRVTGYLRPVQQWNHGKQSEFKIRKTFD